MSGGAYIDRITHGCKNFEEKENDVASRESQEICGGVLEDFAEKARYTTTPGKTSITFRSIYDEKQGRDVFYAELNVGRWTVENRKNAPYASESTT